MTHEVIVNLRRGFLPPHHLMCEILNILSGDKPANFPEFQKVHMVAQNAVATLTRLNHIPHDSRDIRNLRRSIAGKRLASPAKRVNRSEVFAILNVKLPTGLRRGLLGGDWTLTSV